MNRQPLEGVTVLDFGQVYNGPYCGFLLAQGGARVIKVESLVGETLRARGARSAASYPFAILNTNKECISSVGVSAGAVVLGRCGEGALRRDDRRRYGRAVENGNSHLTLPNDGHYVHRVSVVSQSAHAQQYADNLHDDMWCHPLWALLGNPG